MDQPSPFEAIRRQLALAVGENAVFDGWTATAVDAAADSHQVDRGQARLALPDTPAGLVDLYIEGADRALAQAFKPEQLAAMRFRERIRALVWQRLEIMEPAREAVRQGLAILAMPQNAVRAARIGWRTVDRIWRLAGDTAVDFNHYTKRVTLGAVYAATLLVWLDDRSDGNADTAAFLDRRLDEVMRFEKWKAEWRGSSLRRPSLTRFLGRLRYPAR
jgi:ubiquinone biosynthesis protein COQ9